MAHAFLYVGEQAQGIKAARAYATKELHIPDGPHPDAVVLAYGLFPVEDARKIGEIAAQAPLQGEYRLIVIAAERMFHEAQNALLKLFEEPPAHAVLVLIVPTLGMVLPTLRSRVIMLEGDETPSAEGTHPLFSMTTAEREKFVAKMLDRAKTGNDEEKQAVRAEAIQIVRALTLRTYALPESEARTELLHELDRFLPILHERSAPLKLIFEHLLLVLPKD